MILKWYDYEDIDGKYAMVGELHVASIFKPIIENYFPGKRKYHLKYGIESIEYRGIKYETPEEAMEIVEEWWNDFINKISSSTNEKITDSKSDDTEY